MLLSVETKRGSVRGEFVRQEAVGDEFRSGDGLVNASLMGKHISIKENKFVFIVLVIVGKYGITEESVGGSELPVPLK